MNLDILIQKMVRRCTVPTTQTFEANPTIQAETLISKNYIFFYYMCYNFKTGLKCRLRPYTLQAQTYAYYQVATRTLTPPKYIPRH